MIISTTELVVKFKQSNEEMYRIGFDLYTKIEYLKKKMKTHNTYSKNNFSLKNIMVLILSAIELAVSTVEMYNKI